MRRILVLIASVQILVGLASSLAVAQNPSDTFDFDGSPDDPNDYLSDPNNLPYDPTDWMTSVNWGSAGGDPDEASFEPLLPDFGTRVEIDNEHYGVNAPVIGPGDAAQAFGVRIGRANGPGLLTMTGGTLDIRDECTGGTFNCNTRIRVGNADVIDPNERNPGTFDLSGGTVTTDTLWIGSGSHGEMIMSGGEVNTRGDFSMDWTSDLTYDTFSELTVTGGTINVGTHLRLFRFSTLNLDGGEIHANFAALLGTENGLNEFFTQTPDVTVNITDGLLEAAGALEVGGVVNLDGGILRANRYIEDPNSAATHVVEINGSGLLQFNNSQESALDVQALITSGIITTSEVGGLTVGIVDVGGTNFTQVSVASVCTPGDIDCNGVIDGLDFLEWQRGYPGTYTTADLTAWEAGYGTGGLSAVSAVPEPGSLALISLAGVTMAFGCRRLRAKNFGNESVLVAELGT